MKKLILIGLIGCLTILLSGCSYSVDFVIINNSDDFIEIVCDGYVESPPKILTAEEFDNNVKEWRELSQDRYEIDNETKPAKIKVSPNEALRITWTSYKIDKEDLREGLRIKSLKISGKNGSIKLEGGQVFEGFEPKKNRWVLFGPDTTTYTLRYK